MGSIAGVAVFLTMLLFAAQLVVNLYATSAVTAAAFDAARVVAGAAGGPGAQARAEAHARRLLGRAGDTATFLWEYPDVDGDGLADAVRLSVRARSPARLVRPGSVSLPFATIERTVIVRSERLR